MKLLIYSNSTKANYETSKNLDANILFQERAIRDNSEYEKWRNAVTEVFEKCKIAGWDEGNELPITLQCYDAAHLFIDICQAYDVQLTPEVDVDPLGYIVFEWHCHSDRKLTVGIKPDNTYFFVWRDYSSKDYPKTRKENGVKISLDLPHDVMDLIHKLANG